VAWIREGLDGHYSQRPMHLIDLRRLRRNANRVGVRHCTLRERLEDDRYSGRIMRSYAELIEKMGVKTQVLSDAEVLAFLKQRGLLTTGTDCERGLRLLKHEVEFAKRRCESWDVDLVPYSFK